MRLSFSHCFHIIKMLEKRINERMKDLVYPLSVQVVNKRRAKDEKQSM